MTTYRADQPRAITRLEMFPFSFQGDPTTLDQDTLWIFEYRQLMQYNPEVPMPPFICVVERNTTPDPVFFVNRVCAVITTGSMAEMMTALAESCFECGSETPALAGKTHQLLQYQSIPDLLEQGAVALHNPLLLTDENQQILAYSNPDAVASLLYRDIIQADSLPVGHPTADHIFTEQDDLTSLFYVPSAGILPSILCKSIRAGDRVLGYLQLLQFNAIQQEDDSYLMELMGNLLAVELLRLPARSGSDRDKQIEQFLRDILDNKAGDVAAQMERQEKLHLHLKENLYTIVICNARNDSIAPLPLYDMSQRWAKLLRNSYGFLYYNFVFLLYSRDKPMMDVENDLAPLMEELKTYNLIAGIGNAFHSVLEMRLGGYQSRTAIELGRVLEPTKRVYLYSDYALYHMMELTLSNTTVNDFTPPELQQLIDYTAENGTELLETLKMYLRMGRNKSKTAKELNIHINTVKYRLAQIEQIMHMDLDSNDNALRLMLSFKMMDFKESFPTSKPLTARF